MHAIRWRSLCAIATKTRPQDDDSFSEWVERIKDHIAQEGAATPRPEVLTRAMKAVTAAQAKRSPPPPTAERPPEPRPHAEAPPHPEARPWRLDRRGGPWMSTREILQNLMPVPNSGAPSPPSPRSIGRAPWEVGVDKPIATEPTRCLGEGCTATERRGVDKKSGRPYLTIDPTTGLCMACLVKMANESRQFHSRREATQGVLLDRTGKPVE